VEEGLRHPRGTSKCLSEKKAYRDTDPTNDKKAGTGVEKRVKKAGLPQKKCGGNGGASGRNQRVWRGKELERRHHIGNELHLGGQIKRKKKELMRSTIGG